MEVAMRIFQLLDQKKMEQKEFARLVGVSDDTASDWRRGRSKSYTKKIPQIASVLGTSVEYLLAGEKENPAPQMEDGIDENINRLLDVLGNLTPEEQRQVIAYAQGIQAGHKTPASDHM